MAVLPPTHTRPTPFTLSPPRLHSTRPDLADQGEMDDLTQQLGEGGKSSHDLERSKKKLEQEKEALQVCVAPRVGFYCDAHPSTT